MISVEPKIKKRVNVSITKENQNASCVEEVKYANMIKEKIMYPMWRKSNMWAQNKKLYVRCEHEKRNYTLYPTWRK